MPTVTLTRHLHAFFPHLGRAPLEVTGETVAEVVAGLETVAPGIGFYICDERGRLRPHVNIFIGDERVRDRLQLSDAVEPHAHIAILQALSGG